MTTDEPDQRYFHPDLKAIRQRAVAALRADMDAVLAPAGYVRSGNIWQRMTGFARTLVELQRSASGHACYINIVRYQRFLKREWIPQGAVYGGWRLGDFLPAGAQPLDQLFYLDLDQDPELRPRIAGLLTARVLPFLKRAHMPWGYLFFPPAIARQRSGRA